MIFLLARFPGLMRESSAVLLVAAALLIHVRVQAEDWPRLLGPAATGVSTETGLLDKFPAQGPPMVWTK
jgi:outer membrane protein assembly factor BamB